MGLLSRMTILIKAKMNQFLERSEDPAATLDYSYERQLDLLQNVKRGIVDVATSRKRLELQSATLRDSMVKLDDQARQALSIGREDLATMALQRKMVAQQQLDGLQGQIADLQVEQNKLETAESRLAMQVEAFRTKKETVKARYSAAEAQVKIGESVTGISEEMADVGMALDHAENKTQQMQARAAAIDELTEAGTLQDLTGSSDVLDRELGKAQITQGANAELEQMKKQLASRKPKELQEGQEVQEGL